MEEGRRALIILTRKQTGKRPLGSPRRKWEDYIIMYIKIWVSIRGIGLISARDRVYWIHLVNVALKFRVL